MIALFVVWDHKMASRITQGPIVIPRILGRWDHDRGIIFQAPHYGTTRTEERERGPGPRKSTFIQGLLVLAWWCLPRGSNVVPVGL